MNRFLPMLLVLSAVGCSGPAPAPAEPVRIRPARSPVSAFEVPPETPRAPAQVLRQRVNPVELFGMDFADFPAHRLVPADDRGEADAEPSPPLVEILREFVAPGRWPANSLSFDDGLLVARNSPAVLGALQSALQSLRENRDRLIRSRVRLMALRRDSLAGLENIPAASGGLVGVFERDALDGALRGTVLHPAITSPTLTTFNGQKGHVMILSQKSYVAGYEAGEGPYDPQMAIATEGMILEIRAMANGSNRDEFLLRFDAQLASPSEIVEVRLGAGVVQMPAQGFARLSGRCALGAGQSLLLVTRNPDARQPELPILAMTVTLDWDE
jgi:hypothetical protein